MAGFSFRRSDDDMQTISEINVTPFVDVVLVLLVIFMVTAPMLVREQMAVNLPKASTGEKSASRSLNIVIDKLGIVRIMDKIVPLGDLAAEIKSVLTTDPNAQAVISADQEAKHGDVVQVMDIIKSAGLTRFAIQIEKK
ncbi:MAG: biopolymer transporter ExbD [Proteobacteria bacterium]|nr:biopolymer transporter ExbD [Pseudomonadota bacterium]